MKRLFFLLALVSGFAFGQTVPATSSAPVFTSFANAASAGNVLTAEAAILNAQNSSRFTYGVMSDGAVAARAASTFKVAGAAAIPIQIAGKMSRSVVAAALGRFALKQMPLLTIGVGLYELGKELGFNFTNTEGSAPTVTKSDPAACTTEPCFLYRQGFVSPVGVTYENGSAACANAIGKNLYGSNQIVSSDFSGDAHSGGSGSCHVGFMNWGAVAYSDQGLQTQSVPAGSGTPLPATVEEFAAAIGDKTLWVPSSAIARSIHDAIQAGDSAAVPLDSITGPATSPGASTVKTDTAAGTTTTTTTTNNYAYDGPRITIGATTTTNIVNNSTGASTSTTTESKPAAQEPVPDPCDGNPDRVGCLKAGDIPETPELPRTSVPVAYSSVLFAAPAGCPAALPFSVFGRSYAIPYTEVCNVLAPIRLIFLAFGAALAATIFIEGLR